MRREVGDGPVEAARVVDAESQALGAHGVGERADEVAARAAGDGGQVARARRIPQGDAVVVLGRRHHVVGADRAEQARPVGRVVRLGVPVVEERRVGCVAVLARVMRRGRRPLDADRVRVPLGVGVVREPLVVGHGAERPRRLRPRGHGVRAPVHEDAERRVLRPLRQRSAGCPDRSPRDVPMRVRGGGVGAAVAVGRGHGGAVLL